MKKIMLLIAMLFAVVTAYSQTVTWESSIGSVSSGSYSINSNNTSFTYDSDFLYANFWLDTDGHTMNYHVTVKNIPYNPGNMMGEFQATIAGDGSPQTLFANKQILWNAPIGSDPAWENDSYPTSSTYSYGGSCDLGSTTELEISTGILFWNGDDYAQSSMLYVFPKINR